MHLMELFGRTVSDVERWANNVYTVETGMGSDSRRARAKSIGLTILSVTEVLEQIHPDIVFVLGDRGEVLAMTIAALELNIPIMHLFGGDVCQGGVDEPVRHAITKLASLHLTSNAQSAQRIVQMGEEPWRIHNVGSPALDLIHQKRFTPADQISDKFKLDLDRPILIVLQHSVTWQVEAARDQMLETMKAIALLGHQTIVLYPCSDPGYSAIVSVIKDYANRPNVQIYPNLDFPDFWGLMHVADALIGNSSSGLMEAPSFKLPFINVGIRQKDRLGADNVLSVGHDSSQIVSAVERALHDAEFRRTCLDCSTPYGDGYASRKIIRILKEVSLDAALIQKKMTY